MLCPLCKTKMVATVALTGGCGGHYSEDDRCYCDSADVHVEFSCPKASPGEYKQVGKKMEWVKNKNACKQPTLKIGGLSDQYSMGPLVHRALRPDR